MDKIKWLGIFALAGGLIMLGYQGIESIMQEGAKFNNYTLLEMFSEDSFGWIDSVPTMMARDGLIYLINAPFYTILLVVGVFCLVFSGIFARK